MSILSLMSKSEFKPTKRNGLYHWRLDLSYVEAAYYDHTDWPAGGACTTQEAEDSLTQKVELLLEQKERFVSLWLDETESMCLAIALDNCALHSMRKGERECVDYWCSLWHESEFAKEVSLA